jgi:hypothetical protein
VYSRKLGFDSMEFTYAGTLMPGELERDLVVMMKAVGA